MNGVFVFLLSGLLGGVLRGLVGIAKSKMIEQGKFEPLYFGLTLGVSVLVGILEGLYRLRFKQFFAKS